ncbi:MAG TPA: transposase, partial [Bacteroidales bacterium]|nr:transposase [Bacteroidales bacterium]
CRTKLRYGAPQTFSAGPKYLATVLRNKKCLVYAINGTADHVHILFTLHPSVSLSDLIKDLKLSTSSFIRTKKLFPMFDGWQEGYGAFTYTYSAKENLIRYVSNQQEHHKKISFYEELKNLLIENEIDFDEGYLI